MANSAGSRKKSCPACGSAATLSIELPYPKFGHHDFALLNADPSVLIQCESCSLIAQDHDADEHPAIDRFFLSHEYAVTERIQETNVDEFDASVSLSFLQAELLSHEVTSAAPAILDIGCFDGRLLREIAVHYPESTRLGFDVSARPQFDGGEDSKFVTGSLSDVDGRFDMIMLSQSLQYIRDIPSLFRDIDRLLSPEGKLFIHAPNCLEKPCSLLLGDQHYYFSPESMANLLSRHGFRSEAIGEAWFPRDILVIGQRDDATKPGKNLVGGSVVDVVAQIDAVVERLEALAPTAGRTGVLGTTIDAAFVGNQLGDRVAFFVDENTSKIGRQFHGKPVIHPDTIGENDLIVIPLGVKSHKTQARLSDAYSGTFVAI